MTNAPVDLATAKARLPNWIVAILSVVLKPIVIQILVPLLAGLIFWYFFDFSTMLGDLRKLADELKPQATDQALAPQATFRLMHAAVAQLHTAQVQLAHAVKFVVGVAVVVGAAIGTFIGIFYYFSNVTIDEMKSLQTTIADVRMEGLRLLPYGSDRNATRYFFHTDVWNHGVSEDNDIDDCDLTIDFMFDGPTFQARNYLLSPKYLGYFFSRVKKKTDPKITDDMFKCINPDISDKTRAVRIVIVDPVVGGVSQHTQDLLVYLNMSALAGYSTFLIPKPRYENALTIIHNRLKQKNIHESEIRNFFEGHGSMLVSYKNSKLCAESAKYDKLKGVGQPDFDNIEDGDLRQALLDVAINYFCFQPARIGRTGAVLNDLSDLRNKLVNLQATTTWSLKTDWSIASPAPHEPQHAA